MMGRQIKKLLLTLQIGDITEFKVRGFVSKYPIEKWKNNTITPNILRKLSSSCPNLEVMEIREGYINFQQVRWSFFTLLFTNEIEKKNIVSICKLIDLGENCRFSNDTKTIDILWLPNCNATITAAISKNR